MNLKRFVGGDFIKFSDWGTKEEVLTIAGSSEERFEEGSLQLVLSFRETDKKLGCNKTNVSILIDLFGDDENNLVGKRVTVYGDPNISFGAKRTGGMRIKAAVASVSPSGGLQRPTSSDPAVWKAYCVANLVAKHPEITSKEERGAFVLKAVTDFFPAGTDLKALTVEDWAAFQLADFGQSINPNDIPF